MENSNQFQLGGAEPRPERFPGGHSHGSLTGEEQTLQEFTGWDEAGILWVENIQSLQELKWERFETERKKIVQEQAKNLCTKSTVVKGSGVWFG